LRAGAAVGHTQGGRGLAAAIPTMSTALPPDHHNPQRSDAERALIASERRLAAQGASLTQLMARYADSPGSFDEQVRGILAVTAQTLEADRVSMWRIDRGRDEIRCADLYARAADRHEAGLTLKRQSAPRYFEALDSERVIAAHDARIDPRTREFRAAYLEPNGLFSMLDVPLRRSGVTVGVLCAEHTAVRQWTLDEQHFAIAVAHLIGAALADEERRSAVARLADSESRARLLIDTAHDAFIGIDSAGDIITWNTQAERTFGWTREEALGRSLVETIIPPAFRDAHTRGMERFHQTGEAPVVNQRLELVALHRTGREFPIEITITWPMRVEGGYFFGAFLRDISDRRERDDQLRQAKESAEAATRAKSEFLANMSHELRTPLNGVLGYAQLLQRDRSLNASQREALEAIAKGGAHLLDLINDVLDLSRIEAGRLDIEAVTTDLAQMAIDLKYLVAEAARLKGLLLGMAIAPDTPRRVVLDGRHLRQVLLNLLNNAIKFTPHGEVHLSIAKAGEHRLLFEVSDTGVGIEAGELAVIFEAFTQTRSGAAAGGTGLGLTISQHLIAKMGGELRVQSQPGLGSRFYFDLPLVAVAASGNGATEADLAAPPLDARLTDGVDVSALVADDSTVNRRILAALLESAGVRVITAAGGLEAIALARKHRPNVVFMDLKMADLDGFEATRRLQADAATADIPVIAVTASAFGDTRTAALNAGCADYLPKPVRAAALFAALQKHLGVAFVSSAALAAAPGTEPTAPTPARAGVAARLRDAADLGAITDLEALAQELMGEAGDPALGRRIGALLQAFDFEGLRALAASLGGEEAAPR
jgi:PAS domain S-box-containing protein